MTGTQSRALNLAMAASAVILACCFGNAAWAADDAAGLTVSTFDMDVTPPHRKPLGIRSDYRAMGPRFAAPPRHRLARRRAIR